MSDDADTPDGVEDLFGAFAGEAKALEGRLVASSVREKLFGTTSRAIQVGRFAVLEELGRGGMGVVHAAFDRSLDRKVAVKSILFSRASSDASRRRMAEEAKAMAKLSHANVVHVYEVGEHENRVYIAMEYVDGPTLAGWLEAQHSATEVIDTFGGAGRGLAAAHRAGVVHRDFKPENVLITAAGVPKVADFGLAGVESHETAESGSASGITKTGDCIGTPRYMAPEQHRGEAATPASDQFSFCVALFEALSGTHPFLTDEIEDFVPAMEADRVATETERPIDRSVRRVLLRGLQHDARQRHPSMEALLDALAATQRSRKTWVGMGVAVAAIGTAAIVAGRAEDEEPCFGVGDAIEETWSAETARALVSRFEASVPGAGRDLGERATRRLEDYASSWTEARVDACLATHRGEQSARRLDLRMHCLDERRFDFEGALDVVGSLEGDAILRVFDVVDGLPSLRACADGAALERLTPGDAAVEFAEESRALRRRVATLKARLRAGQLEAARSEAEAVVAEAERIGDDRARAETLSWLGWRESQAEAYADAEPQLRDAFFIAAAAGLDEVVVGIAVDLANLEANDGSRDAASSWQDHAASALTRGGLRGSDLDAYLEHSRGVLDDVSGRHADAIVHFEQALTTLQRLDGEASRVEESAVRRSLGMALHAERRHDAARVQLETALELRRGKYGDAHPLTIRALSALGALENDTGNYERALECLEEALAGARATLGRRNVEVANVANNLSSPLLELKRFDDAIDALELAASIYAELDGHADDLGMVSFNLGNVLRVQGRLDEAHDRFTTAVDVLTEASGADGWLTMRARYGLGICMLEQKNLEEGIPAIEGVFEDFEAKGETYLLTGASLEFAELLLAAGEPARALEAAKAGLRHAERDREATAELRPMLETWIAQQSTAGPT